MARDLVVRIGARGVAAAVQALLFVILAKDLGAREFGVFVLAISVGAIVGNVLSLGAPTRALRVRAETEPRIMADSLTLLSLAAATATAFITGSVALHAGGPPIVCIAVALSVWTEHAGYVAQNLFAGIGAHHQASALVITARALPGLGVVAAWSLHRPFVEGYLYGLIVYCGVLVIIAVRRFVAAKMRLRWPGGMLHYWIGSISNSLAPVDVGIITLVLGASAAGVYGAASRVASPIALLIDSMLAIVLPHVSHLPQDQRHSSLLRMYRASGACSLLLLICAPIFGWAARIVLGQDYVGVQGVATAFAAGAALSVISQVLKADLLARGNAKAAGSAILLGTVFGLAGLFVLTRYTGMMGVAVYPIAVQVFILGFLVRARLVPRWNVDERRGIDAT